MNIETWNKRSTLEVCTSESSLKGDGWFLHRLGDEGKMVLGLPPTCVLGEKTCKSKHVSKQHVSISILNCEELFVRDLETRYGTFVNDRRITSDGVILREFDIIGLGCRRPKNKNDFCFLLRIKDSAVDSDSVEEDSECVESVASLSNVYQETSLKDFLPSTSWLLHPKVLSDDLINRFKHDSKIFKAVVNLEVLPVIENMVIHKYFSVKSNRRKGSNSTHDSGDSLSYEKELRDDETVQESKSHGMVNDYDMLSDDTEPLGQNEKSIKKTVPALRMKDIRKNVESWLSKKNGNLSDSNLSDTKLRRGDKSSDDNLKRVRVLRKKEVKKRNVEKWLSRKEINLSNSDTIEKVNGNVISSKKRVTTMKDSKNGSNSDTKVSDYASSEGESHESSEMLDGKNLKRLRKRPLNIDDYQTSSSSLSGFIVYTDDEDELKKGLASRSRRMGSNLSNSDTIEKVNGNVISSKKGVATMKDSKKERRKYPSRYVFENDTDGSTNGSNSNTKVSDYASSEDESHESSETLDGKNLKRLRKRPLIIDDYQASSSSLSDFIVYTDDEDESKKGLVSHSRRTKFGERDRYYVDNPWTPSGNRDTRLTSTIDKLRKRTTIVNPKT